MQTSFPSLSDLEHTALTIANYVFNECKSHGTVESKDHFRLLHHEM